ncbi:MAG: zinc ABC transporter ATP-binding protein AztA [Beijerinckiaceae bacterium]
MSSPAIRFENLTLGYGRHPAVHHLRGDVERGSLTAVVGPNGAGKSTLLKGIAGSLKPLGGRILVDAGAEGVAWLPQAADVDRSFPLPVYDLISMGLWSRRGMFGGIRRADRARIDEAIAAVGLTGFENRPIGTLSGGQMQRCLFARLLLQDSRVILLDEPFTAIDESTAADLLGLVRRWHAEERTIIAVLHDLDLVQRAFPDTLLIAREPVGWGGTDDVLTPENLEKARAMIEAYDRHAHRCDRTAA